MTFRSRSRPPMRRRCARSTCATGWSRVRRQHPPRRRGRRRADRERPDGLLQTGDAFDHVRTPAGQPAKVLHHRHCWAPSQCVSSSCARKHEELVSGTRGYGIERRGDRGSAAVQAATAPARCVGPGPCGPTRPADARSDRRKLPPGSAVRQGGASGHCHLGTGDPSGVTEDDDHQGDTEAVDPVGEEARGRTTIATLVAHQVENAFLPVAHHPVGPGPEVSGCPRQVGDRLSSRSWAPAGSERQASVHPLGGRLGVLQEQSLETGLDGHRQPSAGCGFRWPR